MVVLYSSTSLVVAIEFHNGALKIILKKPATMAEHALAGALKLLSYTVQGLILQVTTSW